MPNTPIFKHRSKSKVMRRDIKRRLEKALMILQEPGGSTIRSIIKVINKESPILSLRKLLEALQEGINEGFVCMYNGRFKLKQQLNSEKHSKNCKDFDADGNPLEDKGSDADVKPSDVNLGDDDSEYSSDDGDSIYIENDALTNMKGDYTRNTGKQSNIYAASKYHAKTLSGDRSQSNNLKCNRSSNSSDKNLNQWSAPDNDSLGDDEAEDANSVCDAVDGEGKSSGKTTEKFDIKKQRGPRCTSMKKDVRMPSKVNIPFMPTTVPQRSSTFNELLRRSPEPLNGPLYDGYKDFSFTPDKLEYFGTYC